MKSNKTSETDAGRRSFLKKASYAAPAIVTLTALPSFASAGSGYQVQDKREAIDIIDQLSVKYPEKNDFWQKILDWLSQW